MRFLNKIKAKQITKKIIDDNITIPSKKEEIQTN